MQPSAPDFASLLAIISLIVTVEAMNADVNQGLVELIARLTYALLLAVRGGPVLASALAVVYAPAFA